MNLQLHQAAIGVTSSYDALVDLFECVANFLNRLHVHTEILLTPSMTSIIVKILVEVLSVLALATKQIKQGRFSRQLLSYICLMAEDSPGKFAKKLLGESEIEAVVQKLDRLTQEEARMTVVQTLQVVHGLVKNIKVVMDGTPVALSLLLVTDWTVIRVDGRASTDQIRQALGMLSQRDD